MGVTIMFSNIFCQNANINIIVIHRLISKKKGESIGIITVRDTEKSQKPKKYMQNITN